MRWSNGVKIRKAVLYRWWWGVHKPPCTDRNRRGQIQSFHERRDLIGLAITIGIFENLDAIGTLWATRGRFGESVVLGTKVLTILGWTAQQAGMLMVPAALTTAVMMPVIGKLLQKGVPQQYLVAGGMLLLLR